MSKKLIYALVAFIGLFVSSSTQAAEFLPATGNNFSIQVLLSEQDLVKETFRIRAESMPEGSDQNYQPIELVVKWEEKGAVSRFGGPQWWAEGEIPMSPLRDLGVNILQLWVSMPEPGIGFRFILPGEVWAEFRIRSGEGWVFSQPRPVSGPFVWDVLQTKWNQNLTVLIPKSMTEDSTIVLQFNHSPNSNLSSDVYVGWGGRLNELTLTMDEGGRLEIPIKEVFRWGRVLSITINPAGFGGNAEKAWLWYTATIEETGQTAILLLGHSVGMWYAYYAPDDPVAYVMATINGIGESEESDSYSTASAVESVTWGQIKALGK